MIFEVKSGVLESLLVVIFREGTLLTEVLLELGLLELGLLEVALLAGGLVLAGGVLAEGGGARALLTSSWLEGF